MIRLAAAACLMAGLASAVHADCYRRTYSQDHMARNPGQSVEMLEVLFGRGERAGQAFVRAKFRGDGRLWKNGLYC
ncbi:MAG: hypothetical protein AAGJ28_20905, partial [Pseudomonadota bacterium]